MLGISRKQASSFVVSLTVHAIALAVMLFVTLPSTALQELLAIESVVTKEKKNPLDIVKKLDDQKEVATTFNTRAGSVSTTVGGASRKISTQQKLVPNDKIKIDSLAFAPSDAPTPGEDVLSDDIGDTGINGNPQQLVKGYGPALDQLVQELIRMMRSDKLMVVWLFDESGSMTDDQQDIKDRIDRVFKELGIVDREAKKIGIAKKFRDARKGKSLLSEMMLTSVASFGKSYNPRTKRPTADLKTIKAAIDAIKVDKSGDENTCAAILQALRMHRSWKAKKRRVVFVVVSDESGDDGPAGVETVIKQCKAIKAPVYVLGRESCFGSLYAHVRWKQPETGRIYYLPIRRGPETPFAELLQHDGFRRRRDSHMSGFGPYDQVRLCRETGGIFFQLPHEQANLNDYEEKKYAALALREYMPDLSSRLQYSKDRGNSAFRKTIWSVIWSINPYNPALKGIELPDPRYQNFSLNPASFGPVVQQRGKRVLAMLKLYERAIYEIERVRYLRAKEPSRRWRAAYDLIRAQLHWYQLRLFEYGIAMDQFVRVGMKQALAKTKGARQHNRWYVRETSRKLVLPDELNEKRFGVSPEVLKSKFEKAQGLLAAVKENHPGTPWAERAAWELRRPFGAVFRTYYQAPPKRGKSRPRPKPTPPPKL